MCLSCSTAGFWQCVAENIPMTVGTNETVGTEMRRM